MNYNFVKIDLDDIMLEGDVVIPHNAAGVVLFAHGSGSSRRSPRNMFVAQELNKNSIGTFLFDLLTLKEEEIDSYTGHLRFDIPLLSNRLTGVTDWVLENSEISHFPLGYFGASTGTAAALISATERPAVIKAIVSRGGRTDLARSKLEYVVCPTLLIVGGYDDAVVALNKEAMKLMKSEKKLVIIPEATHLFEEPGKLEEVARHASSWFLKYLGGTTK